MLFSYTLHFFAVISAISVLAAPLPDTEKLDFNKDDAVEFSSPQGRALARGDWLRKPHPNELENVEQGTLIGDFLSLGFIKKPRPGDVFNDKVFSGFYVPEGKGAGHLAQEVRAKVLADNKPYVYVEHLPESQKALQVINGADSFIGIWQSVTMKGPGKYIVILGHSESGKIVKYIRELRPSEITWVENAEKSHLA